MKAMSVAHSCPHCPWHCSYSYCCQSYCTPWSSVLWKPSLQCLPDTQIPWAQECTDSPAHESFPWPELAQEDEDENGDGTRGAGLCPCSQPGCPHWSASMCTVIKRRVDQDKPSPLLLRLLVGDFTFLSEAKSERAGKQHSKVMAEGKCFCIAQPWGSFSLTSGSSHFKNLPVFGGWDRREGLQFSCPFRRGLAF